MSHQSTANTPPPNTLTPQQQRAVHTRAVSVVLSSGAGCGKTHVLTERYLAHLRDDEAEVGQVVAITFTDRAARQMRARIRQALLEHLRAAPTLGREPPCTEAEDWARHLRNLETAPISTIHAFAGNLLRQHAVEAGLDPRFEVLEEVLAINIEGEALDIALQRTLTAQTEVGEDLRQLVLLFGWRTVLDAVTHLLRGRSERPWQDWLARSPGEVADHWRTKVHGQLFPRYVQHLLRTRPAIARCIPLLRRHPPAPGPMTEKVEILLSQLPRLAEASDLGQAIQDLTEAAKVGRVGAKAWPEPTIYACIKKAFEDFRDDMRKLNLEEYLPTEAGLEEAVVVGQRFLRVACEVIDYYRERKKLHGVVDFQDLLILARDLLHNHPEVRARLQDRFRFLLIDELQDTDPVQMELIEALCGGGMTAGKLFAVGDHKQSIYRFRGADVHLFRGLRQRMDHEGRQELTVNFRSQPAILEFTNALCGQALPDYDPLQAFHPQANPGPCVEFLWAPRPEKISVTLARSIEADWIARRIAWMIGRERLVVARGDGGPHIKNPEKSGELRPVKAGDVVLLFRAMSNVHLYEAALRQYGLDYYLVGGRAFFAQQEIYDLLNLLRALENPQDEVSLAGTLRSPFCCVSDEALLVLAHKRQGLWTGLLDEEIEEQVPVESRVAVARARRNLVRWQARKDRLSIVQLLGEVFADSGFDAAMRLEFLGERKLANLWKLLDLARTFDRSALFGLAEFIDRLGDLVENQPREEQAATQPESADVVRLMSIHQAKGLEFPVVLVPDMVHSGGGSSFVPVATWEPTLGCVVRPPSEGVRLSPEEPPFSGLGWKLHEAANRLEDWEEDLRTLYVACTRARDYLLLSAALPEDYQPNTPWMLTLAERFDLDTGQCLDPQVNEARGGSPLVKVHDRNHPPPEPPQREAEQPVRPTQLPTPPPRLPAAPRSRPVTLAELGRWLREDAEEDILPADVESWEEVGIPERDRILRAVLRSWDVGDQGGWRALLEQWLPNPTDGLRLELESILQRYADSSLCQQLAQAQQVQWDVEFQVDLSAEGESYPVVQGMCDCLWCDSQGCWHLAFFDSGSAGALGKDYHWRRWRLAAFAAASALHQQTGAWPKKVQVHFLEDGETLERTGSRLGQGNWVQAIQRILAALARGVVPRGRREGGDGG